MSAGDGAVLSTGVGDGGPGDTGPGTPAELRRGLGERRAGDGDGLGAARRVQSGLPGTTTKVVPGGAGQTSVIALPIGPGAGKSCTGCPASAASMKVRNAVAGSVAP